MTTGSDSAITSFTGVYDANGTLAGELSYWIGAHLTGRRHCTLCDITHGTFRQKAAWREQAAELPVPFQAVHLDERDPDLVALTDGLTPCVVAHRADGSAEVLLGAGELAAFGGEPAQLAIALTEALEPSYHPPPAPT